MTTSKNFWSEEIGRADIKVPKTILVEQANYFNEMTKNKLVAKVHSSHSLNQVGKGAIMHEFDIVSPSLGNYTFTLFAICHGVDLYPTTIFFDFADDGSKPFDVTTEEEFEKVLSKIMTHKSTVNAINGLLAQA